VNVQDLALFRDLLGVIGRTTTAKGMEGQDFPALTSTI
jgi:hypothetical protein